MFFATRTVTRMPFRFAKLVNLKLRQAGGAAIESKSVSLTRLILAAVILTGLLGPSYAQNPLPQWADSWTGMHSYLVFSPHGTFTQSFIQSIAPRYDFGWSIGGTFRTDFKIGDLKTTVSPFPYSQLNYH